MSPSASPENAKLLSQGREPTVASPEPVNVIVMCDLPIGVGTVYSAPSLSPPYSLEPTVEAGIPVSLCCLHCQPCAKAGIPGLLGLLAPWWVGTLPPWVPQARLP